MEQRTVGKNDEGITYSRTRPARKELPGAAEFFAT